MGKFVVLSFSIAVITFAGFLYFTFQKSPTIIQNVGAQMTLEFTSFATVTRGLQSLQVAQVEQVELFEESSFGGELWRKVGLPPMVASIKVPVVFTYFVDFKKPWHLEIQDQVLLVKVPGLEWLPPAVDLSKTHFDIKKGSLFRDEAAVLRSLQSKITVLLEQRALQNRSLIIEKAKSEISAFFTEWLKARFPAEFQKTVVTIAFSEEALPRPGPNDPKN